MTSDIGKHPKRRKKENINVTSGEMIDFGTVIKMRVFIFLVSKPVSRVPWSANFDFKIYGS